MTASPERQPSRKKKKHGRRQHWPALLARFPRLFWRRSEDDQWDDDWPVVRPENVQQYPLLAADLTVWREQLEPRFRRLDHRAQILQNQFWRPRVTLIVKSPLGNRLSEIK